MSNRKVLVVLEAGEALPSGVVRGLIYRPFFAADGINATYMNRLAASVIRLLTRPPRPLRPLMRLGGEFVLRVINRIATKCNEWSILWRAPQYPVIYLSKVTS